MSIYAVETFTCQHHLLWGEELKMNSFAKLGLLICPLLYAVTLFGQFETSEVLGTVKDASQRAMTNASVTLTTGHGDSSQDHHERTGNYDFLMSDRGVIRSPSSRRDSRNSLRRTSLLNVNARQRVDATLQVGAVSETVNVSSQAALSKPIPANTARSSARRAIVELPLKRPRLREPGVARDQRSHLARWPSRFPPAARRAKARSTSTACAARITTS